MPLLINLAGFAAGMAMGLFGKSGIRTSWTIGVEVALQNTTLALTGGRNANTEQ